MGVLFWIEKSSAEREERRARSTGAQPSRTHPKADRSLPRLGFSVLVLFLTFLKRSFLSVTIPFEIGDLDRSVRVKMSLYSGETRSCGRVRGQTLG
ncbi:hypothetical protein CRG98_022737 [Punica granatum]|uniref:Uncharacterized protein n=1 Tax=Punica granatum TaxID=22663 RepID=A0A2I0JLR8_PUNGR|nr:hypothetical protein CRG98_022737 [Punica granatum]